MFQEVTDRVGALFGQRSAPITTYAVRRTPPGGGGWTKFSDEWENLDEPIDRETFEINEGTPPPGTYRCLAVRENNMLGTIEEDLGWPWRIEPEESEPDLAEQLDELEALIADDHQDEPPTPEEVLQWKMLTDPELAHELLENHPEIVLSAWDVDPGGPSAGDSPLAMTAWYLEHEPERVHELLEQLGEGLGRGIRNANFEGN